MIIIQYAYYFFHSIRNPDIFFSAYCYQLKEILFSCIEDLKKKRQRPCGRLCHLPKEIVAIVFSYSDFDALCALNIVCLEFNEVSNANSLWDNLCFSSFNVHPKCLLFPKNYSSKNIYARMYQSFCSLYQQRKFKNIKSKKR